MSEEMEIIKVETLPEPCAELLNKVYLASKKTNDKLPKGKYKCYGSGYAYTMKDVETVDELKTYILDNGKFKDIDTGRVDEVPVEETTKEDAGEETVEKKVEKRIVFETVMTLVVGDKELIARHNEDFIFIKSEEDYKDLTVFPEEEIKDLGLKMRCKKINYFWHPLVDDEGE